MKRGDKRKTRRKWLRAAAAALAINIACPLTAAAAGWEQLENGSWRYQKEDGSYLAGGFSPDGYYIDGSGIWMASREILGTGIASRNSFLRASQAGSMTEFSGMFRTMLEDITDNCGSVRGAAMEDQGISWFLVGEKEEKELFSFYKNTETDGYTLRLKCSLTRAEGTKPRASWYDYQVLSAILCSVSASGAQLAEAVYLSWEEDNAYGLKAGSWVQVGDAMVKYESAAGAGVYTIRAAEGGV